MRIGVCTTDFPTCPADTLFQKIAAAGFECVQLCFSSADECGFRSSAHFDIPFTVPGTALGAIAEASARYSLPVTACNGTFNMAHPDPGIRSEGIRRFKCFAEAAAALGVKIVSLCSGTLSTRSMWSVHPENGSPAAWENMLSSMRAAAEIAEKYGLVCAVETEASNVIDTPQKARRLMDEIGSSSLKMILDGANLFLAGTARRENVIPVLSSAFEYFGKDIVLAHGKDIAESNGIEFVPTGEGIVDFGFFIQKLREYGYSGDILLHGIYGEEKMRKAVRLIRQKLQ